MTRKMEGDNKAFDVDAAQGRARIARRRLLGKRVRHYKGGLYLVFGVSVDERTGDVLVHYESLDAGPKNGFVWTRSLEVFDSSVPRFAVVDEGT